MKKYARLRSSSSITEQCEPSGRKPSELVPTTLALDDDFSTFKWKSSSNVSVAAASSVHDQGESGVSSSASHRALADALKKLSCLRETQHDDDPGLPRLVTTPHWGASSHMADSYAGSGEPASHSSFSGMQLMPGCAGRLVIRIAHKFLVLMHWRNMCLKVAASVTELDQNYLNLEF